MLAISENTFVAEDITRSGESAASHFTRLLSMKKHAKWNIVEVRGIYLGRERVARLEAVDDTAI